MPVDQTPGSGEFILYPNIPSPFLAGRYRLTATQRLSANGLDAAALPVDPLEVHFDVRSPRLVMPPDQVLSVFPPAETEGSYGARLPQVVIKRRTLPWERQVAGAPTSPVTPFLALVVVADGEGTVLNNVPAAEIMTAGRTLAGAIDSPVGTCLELRQSMVERIFPTQLDVPLLAHARLVDISDTELMMGDDDGFLAVVVANRLPMASADGSPVKYTACLVNLEGQWDFLLPRAPTPVVTTLFADVAVKAVVQVAAMDQHLMGGAISMPADPNARRGAARAAEVLLPEARIDVAATQQSVSYTGYTKPMPKGRGLKDLATVGGLSNGILNAFADPLRRFPVLLSWRFTTSGNATFKALMEGLDSQLLGSAPRTAPASDAGRLPLELVETGHVGLAQRTRRGDSVRAWYRGPFVPHPTDDSARLPLAHAADQLRIVVPDGREDVSLASAFEIGRLLALASPSMVAALLRWRQMQYAVVRQNAWWMLNQDFLDILDESIMTTRVMPGASVALVRSLARAVAADPEAVLGAPRALADPGRALPFEGDANRLISTAFGLPTLRGGKDGMLATLQGTAVRVEPVTDVTRPVPGAGFREADRRLLDRTLVTRVDRLLTDTIVRLGATLPEEPATSPARGRRTTAKRGSTRARATVQRDALDMLIDRLRRSGSRTGDTD